MADPVIRRERSWRWGEARMLGLLDAPPIGWVSVAVPGDDTKSRLEPVYRYRVQSFFYGAKEG